MGSDAEVFVFDHDLYVREVVPGFLELLLSGRLPVWLRPALQKREIEFERWKKADIARFCTYLEQDLSWRGPYNLAYTYDLGWDQRSCKSQECPERDRCPFHEITASETAEQVNWIFEAAVSIKCLGRSQFVGRSMTVSHYSDLLPALGVSQNDPLLPLIARLGKRGFVIGYQWGFGFEGINGWLDPTETNDLAQRLSLLALPRYEPSFEAMKRFRHPESGNYEYQDVAFEALSLSFVRTVAAIASKESKGLLWGNLVMPSHFYLQTD